MYVIIISNNLYALYLLTFEHRFLYSKNYIKIIYYLNKTYSAPSNLSNSCFFNFEASELLANPFSTTMLLSFGN